MSQLSKQRTKEQTEVLNRLAKRRQLAASLAAQPLHANPLRIAVAEDLVHRAQQVLARYLPPYGPSAKEALEELLELLDSPVANAVTHHLRTGVESAN